MAETEEILLAIPAVPTANLPARPPDRSSSPDSDAPSPPRKRPRTHAPSRPAPPPTASMPAPILQNEAEFHHLPAPIHRFPIQPLARFQGASASVKRPREVAHFSYDSTHTYRDDDSSISYYCPPQLPADLKEGFETFNHHEDTENPHLDSLLRALITQEKKAGTREKADFVTWRGMMTKIMTSPFDNFAEFSMYATKHDGTIYIEEDFPARHADRQAQANRPPPSRRYQDPNQQSQAMMTYWGYKFETLALLSTPPTSTPQSVIQNRPKERISNHAQHCSIITTSIGPHTLLLGGEVDGLSGPKPTSPAEPIPWVELKTSEEIPPNPPHHTILKFERKLLKFWAQSFLLGVPKIIVGWRSKSGILNGVQEFETGKIPGMVRRGTGCWDGNVCINFAAGFLGFLRETLGEEGVYKVSLRKKGSVVEVQRVGEGTGEIVSRDFLRWRGGAEQGKVGDEVSA